MTIPSSSAVPSGAEAGPSRLTRPASHLSPHAQRLALNFANIRWAQPPEGGPSIPQGNADVIQYFPQQITMPQSLISAEGRTWKPEPDGAVPDFMGSDKRILGYLGVPSVQIFHPPPIDECEPDAARRIDVRPDPEVDTSVPSSSHNIKEEVRDIQLSFDCTDAAYDEEVFAENGRNRTAEAPSRASSGTRDALLRRIETLLAAAEYTERSSGSSEGSQCAQSEDLPSQPSLEGDDAMEVVACGSDGGYSGRDTLVDHSHASMHPWEYVKAVLNSPHGICALFRPTKTEDLPTTVTEVQEAGLYAGVVGRLGRWWIVLTNEDDTDIMRRPSEIVDVLMPHGSLATDLGALAWGASVAEIAERLEYAVYEIAYIPGTPPTLPAQFMQGKTGGIIVWWSKSIIGRAGPYMLR